MPVGALFSFVSAAAVALSLSVRSPRRRLSLITDGTRTRPCARPVMARALRLSDILRRLLRLHVLPVAAALVATSDPTLTSRQPFSLVV